MTPWLGLLVLVAGCGGGPSTPTAPPEAAPAAPEAPAEVAPRPVSEAHPHVVVITLDTLRADRLGAYGYEKAHSETIDRLAMDGLRFASAWSPLPLTIPSHATMFTGRYPPTLGIRSNGGGVLAEEERTLAEHLSDAGYATAASVSAFVTTRAWGFSQGFDAYFDEIPKAKDDNFWHGERAAEAVIDDALGWWSKADHARATFLWVHLYDVHFPYQPPDAYLQRAEGRPYDGEIAYVDDQVQRLVDAFAGTPTLFAVLADHGEGLGEHDELTHGMFTYAATQHVPFILSGAGVAPGVVEAPVSLADLTPTLLSRVGLPVPEGLDGRVVPAEAPRPVYMETYQLSERFKLAPHVAVVDGAWKLIDTPRPELYDLAADPGEQTDVAAAHPEIVARLSGLLGGFGFAPPGQDRQVLDPAVKAQLEALGYVEGGAMPDFSGDLPDPKDHADLIRLSQKSERQTLVRKPDEAIATLTELIERYPHLVEFRTRKAQMLGRQGKHAEARTLVEEALALDPSNPNLRTMVAGHLAEDGKFEEAAKMFKAVADEVPYLPRVRTLAVLATRQTGKVTEAIDMATAYLEKYPDDLSLIGALGVTLIETGKLDDGVVLLERGVLAEAPENDVAYYLAARAIGRGDMAEGRRLLELEVQHHPMNFRAMFSLLKVYMQAGAWEEQIALATRMVEANGRDTNAWHAKVLALFNLGRYPEAREALTAGLAVDPGNPDLVLMDANLLAKEGRMEDGKRRFEEAKEAKEKRAAEVAAAMKQGPFGIAQPAGDVPRENPLGLPTIGAGEIFSQPAPAE